MLPLYLARIEDLGHGDLVQVDCAACHHVALLTPDFLLRLVLSPSAELLVGPECQARGIIRDTRGRGADRFHWSLLAPDQSHTVAAGHTGRITRGRSLAEMA